jgi:hypothetical protein
MKSNIAWIVLGCFIGMSLMASGQRHSEVLGLGLKSDGNANHSAENMSGIYSYSLNIAVENPPTAQAAAQLVQGLNTPGVDGITLVENWSAIEPAKGVYEWDQASPNPDLFDQWLNAIVAAGKKINLAIRAGADEPSWLFDPVSQGGAGATPYVFKSSPHQGQSRPACQRVTIAAPWDPIFLSEWDAMLGAVAQHLKDFGGYDAVKLVRLTGVNRTTDEFRLPEEILDESQGAPCNTNSIDTWLQAGYRPSRLLHAWDAITTSFQTSFPDKTFNVAIIPIDTGQGQYPFPEIDESGCVFSPPVPANPPTYSCLNTGTIGQQDNQLNKVLFDLLSITSQKFPSRLVIDFENLETNRGASPAVVQAAEEFSELTGFMTNNYFAASTSTGGAACSGGFGDPVACADSASYLALLNIGIYPCETNVCAPNYIQSAFIEVIPPDVLTYSEAILDAHIELHRSANAQAAITDFKRPADRSD